MDLNTAGAGWSLCELFPKDEGDGTSSAAASWDLNPAHNASDEKYYTPFGSGICLSDLTDSQLMTKSCWSTEPSKNCNGIIGKPLLASSAANRIDIVDKFDSVVEPSGTGTNAAYELDDRSTDVSASHCFQQLGNSKNTGKTLSGTKPRNSQRNVAEVHLGSFDGVLHCRAATNHSEQPAHLIPGEDKRTERERQLMARQQMFMQELDRLPPDLRKQYIDYMIAVHLGLLPVACQTVPAAVPGMYYNAAVGPTAVPVTQLIGAPVIMPAGPFMPATPVIHLQPVVPSPTTKSVNR